MASKIDPKKIKPGDYIELSEEGRGVRKVVSVEENCVRVLIPHLGSTKVSFHLLRP